MDLSTKRARDIETIVSSLGPSFLTLHKPGIYPATNIEDIKRFTRWPKVTFNILSYGERNLTHGPKDELAFMIAQYCHDNKKEVMLVLNPHRDKRPDTFGSYYDALLIAGYFYDKIGLVEFVHSGKKDSSGNVIPYVSVDFINSDIKQGKRHVGIHLDLSRYKSSEEIEKIFRNCIAGKRLDGDSLSDFYRSEETKKLRTFLEEEKIQNPSNCISVTNPDEFMDAQKAYHYRRDVLDEMKRMNVIFGSGGSFVRLLGGIEDLGPTYDSKGNQIGPIYVITTTSGNSGAIGRDYISRRGPNRTDDGKFRDKDGKSIWNPVKKKIIEQYAMNPLYDIRVLVLDAQDLEKGIGIAGLLCEDHEEFRHIRPSKTGSMSFSAISKRNCKLAEDGISFPDLLSYTKGEKGIYLMKDPLVLEADKTLNICVVSTDSSDIRYLKHKIIGDVRKK